MLLVCVGPLSTFLAGEIESLLCSSYRYSSHSIDTKYAVYGYSLVCYGAVVRLDPGKWENNY